MKIVIDIPEEDYNKLKSQDKVICINTNIQEIIRNGVSLPEMLNKIRAEITSYRTRDKGWGFYAGIDKALEIIDKYREGDKE